jgi:membrane protein required for colicin V production
MNIPDLVIGIILIAGLIRGFLRGLIYEIAMLGILFLFYFMGFRLASMASPHIAGLFNANPRTVFFISSFLVFAGISIAAILLAKLLSGLINIAALGIFNKIGGAIFSALKFALLTGIILVFINRLDRNYKFISASAKKESQLFYPLVNNTEKLLFRFNL